MLAVLVAKSFLLLTKTLTAQSAPWRSTRRAISQQPHPPAVPQNKRPGALVIRLLLELELMEQCHLCPLRHGGWRILYSLVVGHDVSALIEYRGISLSHAAQQVLDKVAKLGGTGGLIAIDRQGNIAQPFNTSGMYRGSIDVTGKTVVAIYR